MKVLKTNKHESRGIILAATLCTVLILAIIIASYLNLANQVNSSVARSQAWNQAIPVLESGIEEALTQLHCAGTNSLQLTGNNWSYGLDGLYHKTRVFSDGSYFNVSILATNQPVIVSTGFVAVMQNSSSTITNYVSRRVKVVTKKQANTPGGLNAKTTISLVGTTLFDSYDSSDPNYSSNGMYVASMRKSDALALTDSGAVGAISVGNGTVYGSIATGPTGTYSTGPNGAVGDTSFISGGGSGVESGHSANNANVQFNDVAAPFPFNKGVTPLSGTVLGTNYTSYLATGNYSMNSISMSGSQSMAIIGNAVLYVNGSVDIKGQAYIYIAPGASLTMYINGNASFAGNGIVNGTGYPSQCTLYGMPGCTSFSIAGNGTFTGTVDAPDAALSYSGNADAFGSFTGSSISMVGGASIHYDEALANNGNNYVVMSWNEF
jgi:hypothetical protein